MSYWTYPAVVNPNPKIFWLECYDPRFVVALRRFKKVLGFDEQLDLLKRCAGGPMPLAHPQDLPSRFKQLKKNIKFAFEKFESLETFIGVMHEDCGYYHTTPEQCRCRPGKEKKDLPLVGGHLKGFLPGKEVRLFHAGLIKHGKEIGIEEVTDFKTIIQVPDLSKVLELS